MKGLQGNPGYQESPSPAPKSPHHDINPPLVEDWSFSPTQYSNSAGDGEVQRRRQVQFSASRRKRHEEGCVTTGGDRRITDHCASAGAQKDFRKRRGDLNGHFETRVDHNRPRDKIRSVGAREDQNKSLDQKRSAEVRDKNSRGARRGVVSAPIRR